MSAMGLPNLTTAGTKFRFKMFGKKNMVDNFNVDQINAAAVHL